MATVIAPQPTAPRRGPGRPRRSEQAALEARTLPKIVSVFRGVDGRLYHARCGRRVELVAVRGAIELVFHCLGCWEHITLTEAALARVPVGHGSTD